MGERIGVLDAYRYFSDNYGMAERTVQYHIKKGNLPKPDIKEWRNRYYSKELFGEMTNRVGIKHYVIGEVNGKERLRKNGV